MYLFCCTRFRKTNWHFISCLKVNSSLKLDEVLLRKYIFWIRHFNHNNKTSLISWNCGFVYFIFIYLFPLKKKEFPRFHFNSWLCCWSHSLVCVVFEEWTFTAVFSYWRLVGHQVTNGKKKTLLKALSKSFLLPRSAVSCWTPLSSSWLCPSGFVCCPKKETAAAEWWHHLQ